MILADTSVWIDFLRGSGTKAEAEMQSQLASGRIVMHPYILAEISLGSLHNRRRTLSLLESLWQVQIASLEEVRQMIEVHRLYSRGIGLIDVHLLASCLLTPGTFLWTHDARLQKTAKQLGAAVSLP